MQTNNQQITTRSTQIFALLLFLIGGLLIFLLGSNNLAIFPTNHNSLYDWSLTLFLLLIVLAMRRIRRLQGYWKLSFVLFIAACANALNFDLGNFLGRLLPAVSTDTQVLAFDKLSQAITIVGVIILLTLWSRDDLGSIFLKKGNLHQSLRFGLVSFGIFALLFVVIIVFQLYGPPATGLIISRAGLQNVLASIPWILIFIISNSLLEELWFRGLFLRKLTPLIGPALTILITAFIFGISQLGMTFNTPIQTFLYPIFVFAFGLVNAYVMLKTDSLWGPVLCHAGYSLLIIISVLASM